MSNCPPLPQLCSRVIVLPILALLTAGLSACDIPAAEARSDLMQVEGQAPRYPSRLPETVAVAQADAVPEWTAGPQSASLNEVADMALTSALHSRLSDDPVLQTYPLSVDAVGGHVVLRGMAPDARSAKRAAELAAGVAGVVDVENDLREALED